MIYVSTGHFRNKTPEELKEIFLKNNIKNIEFSGGRYQKLIDQYLCGIKNNFNVQIHNYFPVPKKPIVINLASKNIIVKVCLVYDFNYSKFYVFLLLVFRYFLLKLL